MDLKKLKALIGPTSVTKVIGATSVALALTTGTVLGIAAYRSDTVFRPNSSGRALQTNQVRFSGDEDIAGKGGSGESELWEKDQNAEQKDQPQNDKSASYLFENQQDEQASANKPIGLVSGSDAAAQLPGGAIPGGGAGDGVYDITDDRSNADIVISRPTGSESESTNGGGTTGDQPGGGEQPSNPGEQPTIPIQPVKPTTPGGNENGGGSAGGVTPSPTPTPTPSTPSNADTATIEPPKKEDQYDDTTGSDRKYSGNEDQFQGKDVTVSVGFPSWDSEYSLYRGQTIDLETLFAALDAYVTIYDEYLMPINYHWTFADVGEDGYIVITGISFDGGKTIIDLREVGSCVIPPEGELTIYGRYRLDKNSDNWIDINAHAEEDPWGPQPTTTPQEYRIYVLGEQIKNANATIDMENVFNRMDLSTTPLYLYRYTIDMFGVRNRDPLYQLFPGWTENGEPVDWIYDPEKMGRHILEPMDFVPLDTSKYSVELQPYWMDTDEPNFWGDGFKQALCYFQTLTGYNGDGGTLEVPEYINYVNFPEEGGVTEVDTLVLPASVVAVEDTGMLRVHDAYEVSADNRYYSAGNDMLYNKAQTELVGISYKITELTVPETVGKVSIPKDNQISRLEILAETPDELADIDYNNLNGAVIIVPNYDMVEAIIRNNGGAPKGNIIAVKGEDNTSKAEYIFRDNLIIDQKKNELAKVMPGRDTITIPTDVKSIRADAFADSGATRIIVPKGCGANVVYSEGWADGSEIGIILCYTEEDAKNVTAAITAADPTNTITVAVVQSANGYTWYADAEGRNVLTGAPADINTFTGVIPGTGTQINVIAGGAFENSESLQWALLDKCVVEIGARAFASCPNLEGILIDTRDTITIGDGAFDGNENLRFIASNAPRAVMKNDYDPAVTALLPSGRQGGMFFFVPGDEDGYGYNARPVDAIYVMRTIGTHGEKALCALEDDCQTAILRSQRVLNGDLSVNLDGWEPVIGAYAFAHTEGEFTLNFNVFWNMIFGEGAFYDSGLTGKLSAFGERNRVYNDAFGKCKLTKAEIEGSTSMGADVFAKCTELTEVTLAADDENEFDLYAGSFNGCDKLEKLILGRVPNLILNDSGAFQLNYMISTEQEMNQVKIELLDGTSASEVIRKWRYPFVGYVAMYTDTAWLQLLNYGCWGNQEQAQNMVLEAENRIRTMLGEPTTDRPTDLYCYTTSDGALTLTDVITDEDKINLDWDTMEVPEGWYADYLGAGAFAKSPQISFLTVGVSSQYDTAEDLSGIASGVFRGMDENTGLTFNIGNEEIVPELYGYVPKTTIDDTSAVPFTFTGSAELDEKKVHINIASFYLTEQDYLNEWVIPMAGYESYSRMLTIYGNVYENEDEMMEAIEAELLPVENHLRTMLGMSATSELTIKLDAPVTAQQMPEEAAADENGAVTLPSADEERPIVLPDMPETPDADNAENGGAVVLPDTSGEHPVVVPAEPETPTEPETPSGPEQGGEDNANEDPADSGAAGEGEETQE